MRILAIAIATVVISMAVLGDDDPPYVEDTQQAACQVLKWRMAKVEGLPGGKPYAGWYCDFSTEKSDYVYVVALRAHDPARDVEGGYSDLVGWFAVARKSAVVLGYDVNEDRLIPIPKEYYGSYSAKPSAKKPDK